MASMILALMSFLSWTPVQSADTGCRGIDESHPPQYLVFERSGRKQPLYADESADRAWLRLHNNVSCPIQILGGAFHIGPDGVATLDPRDGEEAEVEYDVYDSRRGGEPRQIAGGDTSSVATLRPGFSVVFDVPLSHFRRGLGIAVPFCYTWERAAIREKRVRHYVYLVPAELPSAMRGRLKR
jgi:hypothetical protein